MFGLHVTFTDDRDNGRGYSPVAPGCTGYPVQVINRTIEGRDVYCNTIAEYIWKFGDKPSVFEKYPQVIFDTPGEYEVRLIASTGGWNVPTIQS